MKIETFRCDNCGLNFEPDKNMLEQGEPFSNVEIACKDVEGCESDYIFFDLCKNCRTALINNWRQNK